MTEALNAFDDLLAESFAKFIRLSKQLGGIVAEQADLVLSSIEAQRKFVQLACASKKPDDATLQSLLKPTADLIVRVQALKDKNRKDVSYNHLSAVAEGIAALGWVTVSPTPGPYIKEMSDSAQFYTNKVLVASKDKDPTQVEWAKAWIAFLGELQAYVRKHHTTGLVWNARGETIQAGPPGPPPPPPPAGFFDNNNTNETSENRGGEDSRAALFAALNRGTEITKGLKKVSSDQMTHKNPNLRQTGFVTSAGKSNGTLNRIGELKKDLPPTLELQGKKWIIENHSGNNNLKVDDTSMSQSINVFNCHDSLLVVKGKVNSITVNRCKKFAILFENIVSVVEFIDCQRIKAQANGATPTITIDKTDGIEIYLSNDSLSCEIVSSKSSEINISVPDKNGEFAEHAIPEQLKTIWNGKSFETVALDKM